MTLTVENGSIVTGANSYVSTTELASYASARGVTITGDKETLLIQAMDYIEGLYFIGYKYTQGQSLQWPRANVYIDNYAVTVTTIPQYLKNGLMETALAIDAGESPLADLEKEVQREAIAGVIDITYKTGSSSTTIVRKITNSLKKLLANSSGFRVDKA